jgi:hypothetical protein
MVPVVAKADVSVAQETEILTVNVIQTMTTILLNLPEEFLLEQYLQPLI